MCGFGVQHIMKLSRNGLVIVIGYSQGSMLQRAFAAEALTCVAGSEDGGLCAAGAASGRIYLWQTGSGRLLKSWSAHYKVTRPRLQCTLSQYLQFQSHASRMHAQSEQRHRGATVGHGLRCVGVAAAGVSPPLHRWRPDAGVWWRRCASPCMAPGGCDGCGSAAVPRVTTPNSHPSNRKHGPGCCPHSFDGLLGITITRWCAWAIGRVHKPDRQKG